MVRFVAAPDGRIVPDLAERLPGRGVWTLARREVVDRAVAKSLFGRGLKTRVLADARLADDIESLLARRALDLVALARRAGHAVAGFEKVRALVARGGAALLLHARDGSMDGLGKLAGRDDIPVLRLFDAAELGGPFGREAAVHVALAPGRLARDAARECTRLAGFRADGDAGLKTEGR